MSQARSGDRPPAGRDRLAEALASTDADARRALLLAGVRTEAQLAALEDWRLLRLQQVGKTTVRKIHRLMRSLGLRPAAGQVPRRRRFSVSLQLDGAEQERLAQLAAAAGLKPVEWLRQVLADALAAPAERDGRPAR